ncbi:SLATT domain-containing protein [Latilactobacillus curvatus]|uniref:SLATT domain-containing protein n=1 Tax=Latilactobacillus curvatus TaxID=28038 RepID=UPI0020C797C5|nr:SLATT domain-containing protein [Latilactobacillus curvatus]MCP8850119.1 SLATT domain-containing protein [Latilactobacillus curvatus]
MCEDEKKAFLEKNVWVTEKIRMEAEEIRLRLNSRLSIFLNLVTSLIVVLSTLDLCVTENKKIINFSLLSLMLSIIVVSLTLIVTNWNLEVSANNFKNSYLDLQELYLDAEDLELSSIKKKYNEILRKYDNHNNIDYIYFKFAQAPENENFSCKLGEKLIVYLTKIVPNSLIIVALGALIFFITYYAIIGI